MPPRKFLSLTQQFLSKIFGSLVATELSILHFVFFYKNFTKISQHESKLGFFPSRSHIGRDSGCSSKIGIIPTKSEWLDRLNHAGNSDCNIPPYFQKDHVVLNILLKGYLY